MLFICNIFINFADIKLISAVKGFYCLTIHDAKLAITFDIYKYITTKFFSIMAKRKISLAELYKEKMAMPSPGRQLIQDLMDATGRSEVTVRLWISGKFKPEPIIRNVIADTLGIEVDGLFPDSCHGN